MPTVVTADGITVAWDMCRECMLHVTVCTCSTPRMPKYLETWVNSEPVVAATPVAAPTLYRPSAPKAERHPTGRKVRADKGKPRKREAEPTMRSPCAAHTAESRLNPDGSYTCTVEGCAGQ
jgi:hypothetical protein